MMKEVDIQAILAQLTTKEKVALLHGTGMDIAVNIGSIKGRVPGAGGETFAIDRLGIPATILCDGPAGVRIDAKRPGTDKTFYTTAFPCESALASTWDRDLAFKMGQAMGNESLEYGIDIFLAPGVNIQRNPLGGRSFEYLSEDPVLSGEMAVPIIEGIQSQGVGASLKHYAANNQETNRTYNNSLVSERAMRELYLRAFEIAVKKAKPWTLMTSYNKLNGTYTSERYDLNTQILRDEWGFDGVVMTDWYSGFPDQANILDDSFINDVSAQIRAGNDLTMPGMDKQQTAVLSDIECGALSIKEVDIAVTNVLKMIFKTPAAKRYAYNDQPDLTAHAQLARQVAAQGIVMLKNKDQTLPLNFNHHKIAPFGVGSTHLITGGTGSSEITTKYKVSVVDGLTANGAQVDKGLVQKYKPYTENFVAQDLASRISKLVPFANVPELTLTNEEIEQAAINNTVALFTIGRNATEMFDLDLENDFYLRDTERMLLQRVSQAFRAQGKKVIVLLNIGSPIETASWEHYADAILVTWMTGSEGGNGVADVISGAVNPSSKLPMTFPLQYSDVPSSKSFFGTPATNPTDIRYTEGIYVGYRYYDAFAKEVAYPFGYGLSYTDFAYSDIQIHALQQSGMYQVSVKIKNIGQVAGRESVQLYVAAPNQTIDKPLKVLADFSKTDMLSPGQTETLTLNITPKDLASFYTDQAQWLAEAGDYEAIIGRSSRDMPLRIGFRLEKPLLVEQVKNAFIEKLDFQDLTGPRS